MFVVGDVHGHRDVLAGLLRDSGLVDGSERWRGGDARLWLLGDLVDRGPDGIGASTSSGTGTESGGAAGAFAGQSITLFGYEFESGFPAYVAVATAGTVGYLIGSIGGWALGDYLGRPWLEHHGRWLHLSAEKLDRAERWFDRWEEWAVFLGRITPVMRSFISIPAGVFRARFHPYVWLTLLGSALWCFAFAAAGWAAGASWEKFHDAFRYVDYVVAVAVVLAVAAVVWHFVRRRRVTADEPA